MTSTHGDDAPARTQPGTVKSGGPLGGAVAWGLSTLEWVLVGIGAWLAYEILRGVVVRAAKRRYEGQIDRFLRANEIPTDAFRHTHRVVVKEMVLAETALVEAIAARAREDGVTVAEVRALVRGWLDEIVPQFNLFAYYKVGYAVARLAAYSVYHVRLDKASLEAARAAIPDGAAVVYVSNHRSNADFVVTGFMLSKSVQVSYAVGEWARIWPLESLFKSFGSYFVRRGEKDPLYHRTLEAYVQLITKQGVTQAMFPEGGLSRDGALRPVKLGLLDSMARAKLDPEFRKPLVFVPVGINFDRVMEDEVLVREAAGRAARPKRSLGRKVWRAVTLTAKSLYVVPVNTARFLAKRMKKHGVVAIHFGEPVVFDDWYEAHDGWLAGADRHARWERLRPFAEDLLARIGSRVPATPVTLACLAASSIGRTRMAAGVDRGDIVLAMRDAQRRLAAAGTPFATGDPYAKRQTWRDALDMRRRDLAELALDVEESEDLAAILDRALDVTQRRRILYRDGGRYRTDPARWPLVEYYANSLRTHAARKSGGEEE